MNAVDINNDCFGLLRSKRFYTENFGYSSINGLEIINPFKGVVEI